MEPESQSVSVEIELSATAAGREIDKALTGGRRTARRYVKALRALYPNKSPAELTVVLENFYTGSVSAAGGAIKAGHVAIGLGLAVLAGKVGGTGKAAMAKNAGLGLAGMGAPRLVELLDRQSRFQITAGFALALADIHGMRLDKQQAHALVVLLSNGDVSSQRIATIANELAVSRGREEGANPPSRDTTWATTLADLLPGSAALQLVSEVGAERMANLKENLTDKQRAAFDVGAAAVVGGVSRFSFGREVVKATRSAFPKPPDVFPAHLVRTLRVQGEAPMKVRERVGRAGRAVRGFVADRLPKSRRK